MSLIKEYLSKTKEYSEQYGELTILFMQNGAFFEVYGLRDNDNNIIGCKLNDFSKICDLNIVDKKAAGDKHVCVDNCHVVNAGFKTHLIEKYIKKMQDNGYTIVVYEEDKEIDYITKRINRSLTGIFSPGTFFSPDTNIITNNTCCIWLEVKRATLKSSQKNIFIGVSQIDIYTGNTSIHEYTEIYIQNPTTFDELERVISIHNPSETIVISNLSHDETTNIINFANIKSKSLHIINLNDSNDSGNIKKALNCEKQTYQTQLLHKFYQIVDINSFMNMFNNNVYATQSFCFLLDFIYQHNPNLINKIGEPVFENVSNRLILANHSLKQLNIIDDDNYNGKYSSVVRMLNECLTAMGKRKFIHNFLNPVIDDKYLNQEYAIVELLLPHITNGKYAPIKHLLSNIRDLSKIVRQIILQKVSPKSLYQLWSGIINARSILEEINSDEMLKAYLTTKIPNYNNLTNAIDNITNYMDSVLVLSECKDIENIYKVEHSFVKNGVDKELDDNIHSFQKSQDQLDCCRKFFNTLISNYEIDNTKKNKTKQRKTKLEENDVDAEDDTKIYVRIHETEKNFFSLLATDRRCKILEEVLNTKYQDDVSLNYYSNYKNTTEELVMNFKHDKLDCSKQSSTNKCINNHQIRSICSNINTSKNKLIGHINRVFQQIVKTMETHLDNIDQIVLFITYIDLIYTKAFIAHKFNYCKPVIDNDKDKSFVNVKSLRHCLIEKIQQSELYVANDLILGDGNTDGILLYGTNAVGKTSFIRALGISIVMAQAGLYVPASNFVFKPYKYIFTRILGNDNLFKGLSTFAVEMSELRIILQLTNPHSLVLGDELCSGTESISAVSIFVSGIQSLYKTKCSFIFATHLHEIITYSEITELETVALKHMAVMYDKKRDCLVYNRKLCDGPGNNMYGLEVCKSLSLPADFLDNAHNIRMKYHPTCASMLDNKTTHYNSKCIRPAMCEKCHLNPAKEVHHLIYQQEANDDGIIVKPDLTFHKNNAANLLNVCETCHHTIHNAGVKYKKTKTTKGMIIDDYNN